MARFETFPFAPKLSSLPTMRNRLLCAGIALLTLVPIGVYPQSTQIPWEKEIQAFEAADRKQPPTQGGVVFVGSSSIAMWKTLAKDFPAHNVLNRGFGGSLLADSVRFADRIVTPYHPRLVVLFAGTNDIAAGVSAEKVFADYRAFVEKVRTVLPATRIAYLSITPAPSRWNKLEEIRKANQLIRDFALNDRNLIFIDAFPYMLDTAGNPRPELFLADQLHMNAKGYAIWRDLVEPYLPWR
jgi:lysophospholipase L1-like esterase